METIIDMFMSIKAHKDALDTEYETFRKQIIDLMTAQGIDTVDIGNAVLIKEDKNYITYYPDGIEMIKKLQPEAVTEHVNNKAVKNAIASGEINENELLPYKEIKVSKAVLLKKA